MINDFQKEPQFSSLFEEAPLIKNISFEMDKGLYHLLDNKGSSYLCDLYGKRKPKFKYNISGFINGEQRKVMIKSKSSEDILSSKSSKLLKKSEDDKSYFPSVNKFEGYAQFPRPICSPFGNFKGLKENKINILKKQLSKNLNEEVNKNFFKKIEENKGLSYITSDIKGYLNNKAIKESENNYYINSTSRNIKRDKNCLIKLIDNTLDERKTNSLNSIRIINEDNKNIRALINFKKRLINNDETTMINGRKLKLPNQFAINEYKLINNKIFNEYKLPTNNLFNQHKNLVKSFSQLNMQLNQIMDKKNQDNNKIITGRKILSKITINKRPNNSTEKILFSNSINTTPKLILNKNEHHLKSNLLYLSRNKNQLNIGRKNSANLNEIRTQKNRYIYEEQETKESLTSKPHDNIFIIKSNFGSNNSKENISFISDNEKIFKFKSVQFLRNLKKKSQEEKHLLEGFKKEEVKKPIIFGNKEDDQPKYKDFGEIYKKELETLEKCNPTLFELQRKNNEKEMKKLKKRKEIRKIVEKNKNKKKSKIKKGKTET